MAVEVRAPMVGKIIEILVAEGDRVEVDAELLVIESMKMEIPVASNASGTVLRLHVTVGDTIQEGDKLITLEV